MNADEPWPKTPWSCQLRMSVQFVQNDTVAIQHQAIDANTFEHDRSATRPVNRTPESLGKSVGNSDRIPLPTGARQLMVVLVARPTGNICRLRVSSRQSDGLRRQYEKYKTLRIGGAWRSRWMVRVRVSAGRGAAGFPSGRLTAIPVGNPTTQGAQGSYFLKDSKTGACWLVIRSRDDISTALATAPRESCE